MKLKNTFKISSLLFLLFLAGCSSPLVYSGIWQDKPVTIDGKATEWKIPLDYYDDKTKLNFSISNDKTNLYFCIRATEDETQKGIIHSGLQVWIDTGGSKKTQVGIQFPVIQRSGESSGTRHSQSSGATSNEETPVAYSLKSRYAGTHKQIRLTGFGGGINGLAETPNMYGINACLNWDTNNIMIYEISVPFSTFYKTALIPSDSTKVLDVSFFVSVASQSYGGGEGGGRSGGMGGGMGGMHGGGGGGGHGGGGHSSGGSDANNRTLAAHVKIRLSTQHL